MNKNSFTEPELNKLGWKVVSELSGDRTIKDTYTATGKPENERVVQMESFVLEVFYHNKNN